MGREQIQEAEELGLDAPVPADMMSFGVGYGDPETDETLEAAPDPMADRKLPDGTPLLGEDPGWLEAISNAARVAGAGCRVLIEGETGTGKELVAKLIHQRSRRADGPFVPLNCSSVPVELFESELFGHEKGSFTGATGKRGGLFRQANRGTLFLDDVAELPRPLQAKLLRTLQEGTIRSVGSDREDQVDVRVVAAANVPLLELVNEGRFRADLLYRLDEARISLPPLRIRGDDVLRLAGYFASRYELAIAPDAHLALRAYPWPGNVRQLENAIRGIAAMWDPRTNGNAITGEKFQARMGSDSGAYFGENVSLGGVDALVGQKLADVERELVLKTLEKCAGVRTEAARVLDVKVRTLRRWLAAYRDDLGIPVPEGTGGSDGEGGKRKGSLVYGGH